MDAKLEVSVWNFSHNAKQHCLGKKIKKCNTHTYNKDTNYKGTNYTGTNYKGTNYIGTNYTDIEYISSKVLGNGSFQM